MNTIISQHTGGTGFSTQLDGHLINIDTSHVNGGSDHGPRPKALMLVSLAGCTGIDVVDILNKMRVTFSNLTIKVAGELTSTIPQTYHTVTVTYTLKVKTEDQESVEKAIALSQDKYCGVSTMFRAFAKINVEVVFQKL